MQQRRSQEEKKTSCSPFPFFSSAFLAVISSSSALVVMGDWVALGNANRPSSKHGLSQHYKGPTNASADPELQQPLTIPPPVPTMAKSWKWWLMLGLNTAFVVVGQTAATLLGRFYYDQGGSSKWLQTLTLSAGFPILYIPLLLMPQSAATSTIPCPSSLLKISLIYAAIGFITTGDSLMYSYGLLYLSVSTYSLVSATQLGFNAIFSYFINSERFTVLTFNSVILLTFSAAILAVHSDDDEGSNKVARGKYALGFILTLAASATYSLILSLMELTFQKVVKSRSFAAVLNMQIYTALFSTIGAVAGLFGSGEWKDLKEDMEGFKKGIVGYVMTLVWAAVAWQVTNVGLVGLIFEVSSLFSNVISTLAIPIAPVFAVILFQDSMDALKVMSLLLAIWGFVSYFYQHYLDYKEEEKARTIATESVENAGV